MKTPVLSVSNLTKRYGSYTAVDSLSFELGEGEILGLLGPNGAGKTTTIQMLLDLTRADGGEIKYFGKSFPQHREYVLNNINYASAYSKLQGKLSVRQNLRVYAGFYQIKNPNERIDELLEIFEVGHLANETFWKLSSGQRTRAILARALLNKPKVLLMDEPTASLDPEIVSKTIELVRELRDDHGVSILYTSHNMEEITRLCDRVIFLKQGTIKAVDTPLNLTKMIASSKLQLTFDGELTTVRTFLDKQSLSHRKVHAHTLEIDVDEDQIPNVLFDIKKQGAFITHIAIQKPTLEDVFLSMAQQKESA